MLGSVTQEVLTQSKKIRRGSEEAGHLLVNSTSNPHNIPSTLTALLQAIAVSEDFNATGTLMYSDHPRRTIPTSVTDGAMNVA